MHNLGTEPRLQVGALALLLLSAILVAGCTSVDWPRPHGGVYTEQLAMDYRQTTLQETQSLDVLRQVQASCADLKARREGRYLVTRTDTVVANSGLSPDGLKSWFTLFAFDPQTLTAQRKYFLCVDELTTISPVGPRRHLFPLAAPWSSTARWPWRVRLWQQDCRRPLRWQRCGPSPLAFGRTWSEQPVAQTPRPRIRRSWLQGS